MSEKIIETENLTIGYRAGTSNREIAKRLNLRFCRGEFVTLLGPNGAGKSTLLKTLAGFIEPLAGKVRIAGKDIKDFTPARLSKRLGVVLTGRPAATALTAAELVETGRSPYTGFFGRISAADRKIAQEAMELCGVAHMAQRRVATLSDGECQRVMIAKAIAQQTDIILLDEPSAFLDFPGKVELMLLLRRLASDEGKMILISTHDLNIALETSDSLLLLDKEKGLAQGSASALAASGELSRFFSSPHIRLSSSPLRFDINA